MSQLKRGIWLGVFALLLCVSGCSSLLGPASSDSMVVPEVDTLRTSSGPLGVPERVALRTVERSGYYEEVSTMLQGSTPSVTRLDSGTCAVVFNLELGEDEAKSDAFVVYPYVLFVVDISSKIVMQAYRVVPQLDAELLTVESMIKDDVRTVRMSECVAVKLKAARKIAEERHSGTGPVQPKRECDESLTQPRTACWCSRTVLGHFDTGCLQVCTTGCSVLPPAQSAACYGMCCASCWVPAYCTRVECRTIYPCS